MSETSHDLVVIGAGPGGYVAAIRAAQLGFNIACVEKEAMLGGTCLRIGCIPSKALLESSEIFHQTKTGSAAHGIRVSEVQLDLAAMMKRKEQVVSTLTQGISGLFKKNKVTRYTGHARIDGAGRVTVSSAEKQVALKARDILIATGSRAAVLPGIELDGDRIGTSTEALSFDEVPRRLAVIGGGYIGLELGSVWNRLGAKITVVEYLDRILPGMDREVAEEAQKIFARQGIEFRLSHKVAGARREKDECVLELAGAEPLACDRVLVAIGRVPNTEELGLESANIQLNGKGQIEVNERFETSAPGIFAIGDVIRGPMLAHKAEEEGIACVESLATGYGHVDYNSIPGVVYTHPEIASVGKTEEELAEQKIDYRKGVFPFRANGRAHSLGQTSGKVKLLADAKTDRLLGVHIIGPRAGDLIAEAAVALAFHASSEDLARCSHAHPTLSEALKEAALSADGRAIHF
jgi:dihydrolipoamide dehydrogenase